MKAAVLAASVALGSLLTYATWIVVTGGGIPLEESAPPQSWALFIAAVPGALACIGLFYLGRHLAQRRGLWDA